MSPTPRANSAVPRIVALTPSDLRSPAALAPIVAAFGTVKPDSIVCRLPPRLVPGYFDAILAGGGRVLVARLRDTPVGFLIFTRDNNVTLEFLRREKLAVALHLALSPSGRDKLLLVSSVFNGLAMIGRALPSDFNDEISLLAVADGAQGRGIGTALVERLRAEVPGPIAVKTDLGNSAAIGFYEARGFVRRRVLPIGMRKLVCFVSDG